MSFLDTRKNKNQENQKRPDKGWAKCKGGPGLKQDEYNSKKRETVSVVIAGSKENPKRLDFV